MPQMKKEKQNLLLALDVDAKGQVRRRVDIKHDMWIDNSLLEAIYPGIRMALVSVPSNLEPEEQVIVINTMSNLVYDGTLFKLVGASGSAKNGKFYFASAEYADSLARRFQKWPEAAITYFGILTSDCQVIARYEQSGVLVVPDNELGTNDCRGWISQRAFEKLGLPSGAFYQFRIGYGDTQGKGSVKVMSNEVADHFGVDFIVPESSIKPAEKYAPFNFLSYHARRFNGTVYFGVREYSRTLTFEGSYTVAQHATWPVVEQELIPKAKAVIEKLNTTWIEGQHAAVLEMIGASHSSEGGVNDGQCETVEALLLADGSGEIVRHPWVLNQLKRLMARWAYKVTTGGGMKMPGFALADDGYLVMHDGKIYTDSDWIPLDTCLTSLTSKRSLCVRFPVRMREDFLPMLHMHPEECVAYLSGVKGIPLEVAEAAVSQQLYCSHTYTLHSKTAKKNGGDYDFDQICVIDEAEYPMFVEDRFEFERHPEQHYQVIKTKAARVRSGWYNLEAIAMNAMGNKIGMITNTMSSALAAGRPDLAYLLVPELQKEIDSLKHNTRADMNVVIGVQKQVGNPFWLDSGKLNKDNLRSTDDLPISTDEAPLVVAPTDVIGRMYLTLRQDIEELLGTPMALSQFKGLIMGGVPTREMIDECRMVNSMYGMGHKLLRQTVQNAREAAAAARAEFSAAKEAEDQERLRVARKKLRAASALLREKEKESAEGAKRLSSVIAAWGRGKEESERRDWLQAMNQVVSTGPGTGAAMFQAFTQEIVNAIAERTGGTASSIATKFFSPVVRVENDIFFRVSFTGDLFPLFGWDRAKRRLITVREYADSPMRREGDTFYSLKKDGVKTPVFQIDAAKNLQLITDRKAALCGAPSGLSNAAATAA
jgi:hypothetical protein